MDAKHFLQTVGSDVREDFAKNRSILSFEEYLGLFFADPRGQARNAAQYLKEVMDHYGTEEVPHPTGTIRRFKVFDGPKETPQVRVAGQEEIQNDIYRLLSNFVRVGRVNKLILMHGPNGSAKSSIVDALCRGLEEYSKLPEGAVYKINWVFPTEKLVKGSIGFGERTMNKAELASYAHLEMENVEVRVSCEMRDHPLFVVPRERRRKLLEQALGGASEKNGDQVLSDYLLEGELCHKCRRIYTALLQSHDGDYLKVLRHIQVERFYLSRHYQIGAMTVEPQMSVDASYHQVTADRSQLNLPSTLQNLVLFEPHGALVSANRGVIEYSDLLKRPLEAFKYLLGFSETGEVPLEHFILQLDEVLIASSNEKHLSAFKDLPDFASFKGRIELVRVPYIRRYKVEQEIYDAQISSTAVGKHVAPHSTEVAAMWAVLTRLKKPISDRYPAEVREVLHRLSPREKLHLYQEGRVPDRLSLSQAKEVKKQLGDLYRESDTYPNYEGRQGASAREIKTALFNAAQNPDHACLSAQAVFEELAALCKDKSVYEFLQQEVVEGYHDHEELLEGVREEYLDRVDAEVRDSMGLVSEAQYQELFERYIQHVSHWVKGEKMRNRITGEMERPDEQRMDEMEVIFMPAGEDAGEFRRGLIAQVGAHKLDHPDIEMDYTRIFPDLHRRLRIHFFEERKRVVQQNTDNLLKSMAGERSFLSTREVKAVDETLETLKSRYGYCENCAKDTILVLARARYA